MEKKWLLADPVTDEFTNSFPEINPLILQLLYNRGLKTQAQIDEFSNPDYGNNTHDPFLFLDMAKAVDRILNGIAKKEKMVVYGDYDADGVTATTIVATTLKALGADVDIYIPYRETEGYGLNLEAVKQIAANQVKLLITVDCGITNILEIEALVKNQIDVIVTDHHHPPVNLPPALALINPHLDREHYPFKDLAGCGVAYKLVQAVISRHKNHPVNQLPTGWEKWFLDLVAIGTIADMMPLVGENRTLVKYGLIVLQKTRRLGLKKLAERMGTNLADLDERAVGWQIAPRLNAAGRLNHAGTAYQLLTTEDENEAEKLAEELNKTNQERQQITDKIQQEAKSILGEIKEQKILIAVGNDWPTGVVGLVAGRLTDEFHRPALVISHYKQDIVGSGRSIPAFNIIEALDQASEFLSHYGGHNQACGFTVKNKDCLAGFTNKITALADKLTAADLVPELPIDAQVKLEQIDWELFSELDKFIPFGEGNPKPRFLAKNLNVTNTQAIGAEGKHLRLMVNHVTSAVRKTIGFCFGNWCIKIKIGDKVDMVFEVDVNEWNGNRELQLKIIDLKINE